METGKLKNKPFDMAYHGQISPLKALITENDKLKTQTDENNRMLLHWAALGGHEELVTYLLSLNVPVDPEDDQMTQHRMGQVGHVINLVTPSSNLLSNVLSANTKIQVLMGMTPLILTASAGREKIVNLLLKEGANINAQSHGGHSALQYAASKNWKSICANLLEKEANINITDKRGATPLQRAASKGNIEIVKLLIQNGEHLNIDQKDMYGNTALHLACEEDRQEEAKLLVSNGADLETTNKGAKTPLDYCNLILAKQLIEIAKKNMQN